MSKSIVNVYNTFCIISGQDHKDSTRDHSPLQKADDAIIIDTTHLAIDEVVKKIVNIVNHKRTLI